MMKIELDEDILRIVFHNSGREVGVLSIQKVHNGFLHHFSWPSGSDVKLLPKPIGDYSEDTRSGGFKWLLSAYGRAIGVKPDAKEFREKVWKQLLETLQSAEEFARFKEEAVTSEIAYLREIVKRLTIYTREGKEETWLVDLEVEWKGMRKSLRLTTNSVRDPNRVIEAFLKEFGEYPDELEEISRKEWSKHVINQLKAEQKLEFRPVEESDETLMAETVLNFLRNARVTTDRTEALIDENAIFYDGESLVLPSKTIRSLLLLAGYNRFSWNQLRDILSNFIKKNTAAVRFDENTVLKCWFFDPEKVGVDVKERMEADENV